MNKPRFSSHMLHQYMIRNNLPSLIKAYSQAEQEFKNFYEETDLNVVKKIFPHINSNKAKYFIGEWKGIKSLFLVKNNNIVTYLHEGKNIIKEIRERKKCCITL